MEYIFLVMLTLSFAFSLSFFLLVGLASHFYAEKKTSDYLIAGQSVSPSLVGISAVASWCSGFMFIGQIGFTYERGLSSIWIMLGLIAGDIFVSQITHRKLRAQSGLEKHESYVEALLDFKNKESLQSLNAARAIVSTVAIIALVGYSSAQIMSSGKALESVLNIDYWLGALATTILIALYCFSGGIRASIWTDALQALVMMLAMAILLVAAIAQSGGFADWSVALANVPGGYISLFPPDMHGNQLWFLALIFAGWFAGGMGVAGQPHVMIRFMTLKKIDLINRARLYYYVYYISLYALAIGIGLSARVLLPFLSVGEYEMALPLLSKLILPDILVGVILAGLFASTMSTADSLILSSSATLTRDLIPKLKNSYTAAKLATLALSTLALGLAVFSKNTVFQLVVIFGGLLSACFAPVLILKSLGHQISPKTLIFMILASAISTTLWRELGLSYIIYEVAIGMTTGLIVGFAFKDAARPKC